MTRFLFALSSLTSLFVTASWAAAEEPEKVLRPAQECVERGGLPNVLAKLKAGKEVRVGYLGGSITAAPGWRVKSLKWLQDEYKDAKLSEINAAIGGTGSDLGVFRVHSDVLQHKPDLMFVEFAVNDGGAAPDQIQRCMEGIVRQTWRADPATDICFVYTVSQPFLNDLKAGKASRSATAMEAVADHYQIPSIHLGVETAQLEVAGKLIFKGTKEQAALKTGDAMVFSTDGVHPLVETGHELYLQAIVRSWPKLVKVAAPAAAHALAAPLRADNWENAKLVPITQAMLRGSWTSLDATKDDIAKRFANRLPGIWKATAADARLEFEIEGSYAAAYDLVGPDGGVIEIQVDDQPVRKLPRIDAYCVYHRLSKAGLLADAAPGRHRVRVALSAETPDKAKILFEQNRPDLEMNPAKYAPNHWHVGGLMILGDVVK